MNLGEKIILLRKKYHYTQEELAEKMMVSRQSISKWERGSNIPELKQLILLSDIFHTTVDILIKNDLEIDKKQQNKSCHKTVQKEEKGIYQGLLIKESVEQEKILDLLDIYKVELWETEDKVKYWTALYFTSSHMDLPEKLSKVLILEEEKGGPWYCDFKKNNKQYIVFRNTVLSYNIGNLEEQRKVEEECKKIGIPNINEINEK